jgi:hypothetical protein
MSARLPGRLVPPHATPSRQQQAGNDGGRFHRRQHGHKIRLIADPVIGEELLRGDEGDDTDGSIVRCYRGRIGHRRVCEMPQQSIAHNRKRKGQGDGQSHGGNSPTQSGLGHGDAAFHPDGQHQIDSDALGDRFGNGKVGSQRRSARSQHKA